MKKLLNCFVALVILACIPIDAIGESLSFECKFDKFASPTGLEDAKDFHLSFMVDTITNKTVMVGNNGLSDIVTMRGAYGFTFLEVLKTGAVQSTTVASATGQAVHSRNSLLGPDEVVPSQYYGSCDLPKARP